MGSSQGQGERYKARNALADAVSALEDDWALTIRDPYSEDEERWIALGMDALGRLLAVVYVWRGGKVRLISARLATRHERRQYEGKP